MSPGEGETMGNLGIVGYDGIGGFFTWYWVFDNGAYDQGSDSLPGRPQRRIDHPRS